MCGNDIINRSLSTNLETLKPIEERRYMEMVERDVGKERDYPVRPVPLTAVECKDDFWAPRIEINRAVTVPFAFDQCEVTGRIENFRRATAALRGDPDVDRTPPGFVFDDSDVYKVIEGAAYTLHVHPDPSLEAYVDSLVAVIAAAQEPDGYLYTARTIDPENPPPAAKSRRWEGERAHSHELYNLGHLYEAAVAYEQATGKRHLLDVAFRTAALLERTFGPDKQAIWPGHQITELALVKLGRATGEERYLELARFILDARGPDGREGSGREYNQSHRPVIEQHEAVGHAVRATYMYSGMADVAAVLGDSGYVEALDHIWDDVVSKKLYVTGGIGSTSEGEAFGDAYDLPNLTAYSETCAAIGNVFWNHRMFLLHGDARYIDVLERTLYNALIAGVSLDGMAFFYDNPLESDGTHERSPWFGCACCPSNVSRFLPSLPGYIYALQGDTIYVNLFVSGTAAIALAGNQTVKLEQETRYPWDGGVKITMKLDAPRIFTLKIRIPGWARGEAVPSDLYRFVGADEAPVTLKVNGEPIPLGETTLDRGYATLQREWHPGDVVELDLPMPVRRVAANDRVDADRGRVALQRGPLVYCLEWPDNPGVRLHDLALADDAQPSYEPAPDLLGGIVVIKGDAVTLSTGAEGEQDSPRQPFTAIPYFAWANRGPGEMLVWIPTVGARNGR
jgi:uncharacterized protein